jgi:hypothetical protein
MTIWARGRFGSAMLALTLALLAGPVVAQAQQKVLRVVPQGEVKVFDPHQSQVNLTSMHAALVYDTLFSFVTIIPLWPGASGAPLRCRPRTPTDGKTDSNSPFASESNSRRRAPRMTVHSVLRLAFDWNAG